MNKFLAIFSGVFLAFSLAGQSISFESSIDTNRILIGEQTNFHLTAKNITDPNAVVWPVWPDTLRGIEVLRVSSDTNKENELFTLHQHYLITSFDSGFVLDSAFFTFARYSLNWKRNHKS
jgi:hypothetical protein